MSQAEELAPVAMKRPALAPKALIHQKFGKKASYRIEEVRQPVENSCPGLASAQQIRILYRCYLDLPELSVISDPLPKKKDAEHAAAKIAIEKLGIQSKVADNPTPREAMDELVVRLTGFFKDEFLSSTHPLVGHIKVALRRVGEHFGMIPISAIAACDIKVNNLCKIINPKSESDPLVVLSLILRAAKMSASICITYDELWICKQGSYPTHFIEPVKNLISVSAQNTYVEALLIPYLLDRDVETLALNFINCPYYMDEIAQKLHVRDPSRIVVSRTFGKASSEMRLYFSAPDPSFTSDSWMEVFPMIEGNVNLGDIINERASYLSGQQIYGNAIMANVGYIWKSSDLFYEDVTLNTYYRMILGKLPDGHYKLVREAILGAELPAVYTTRSNWKGPTPRDLLTVFCRQHRLSEPLYSLKSLDCTDTFVGSCEVKKKSNFSGSVDEVSKVNGDNLDPLCRELSSSTNAFKCELTILSKSQDLVIKCSFDDIRRKECDAIQSSALKVLSSLNKFFKQPDMPIEKFLEFEHGHSIVISQEFIQELVKCPFIYDIEREKKNSLLHISSNQWETQYDNGISCKIDGPDSGIFPSPASVACISYVVVLKKKDTTLREVLESKDVFEFEIGTGAVISELESCVSQLTVNQSAWFVVEVPSRYLIYSAAGQAAKHLSELSLDNCFLEYSVKLLHVTEPLEDRVEQALFSPPLSKQRVEFAVRFINQLNASSLVDFGCGSGSLLDSLLDHTTTLEKIVGVDISRKSLIRAAKILHLKLSANPSRQEGIRSTILYDGSITDFDSRLHEFDIGTCLEVIEHMEEYQACLFGDVVLSLFCPSVLIVSTPNYEYNPILQRSSMPSGEDSEDKSTSIKFRNLDHKFEWTRHQFQHWANNLAAKHHYSVEFSGVGGSADAEPGFASQIAVFKRTLNLLEKQCLRTELSVPYEVIWEWNADSGSH